MIIVSAIEGDAMIRTVWGEARGENPEGQAAIAHVILTRNRTPAWWGTDIFGVCHAPSQFSCWNIGDPNCVRVISLTPRSIEYQRISNVVAGVLAGLIPDPTGGATHYKVTGTPASWDKATVGITPVIIGHHSFYKLGPKA